MDYYYFSFIFSTQSDKVKTRYGTRYAVVGWVRNFQHTNNKLESEGPPRDTLFREQWFTTSNGL